MEITTIYVASAGAPFSEKKAQAYGEYLAKIEKKEGILTPAKVVEKARSEKSIIHNYFEWEDSIAGEKYRIHQARQLMNHIEVEIIDNGDTENKTIKMFHNIQIIEESKDRGYLSLSSIINSNDYRDQIIDRALAELVGWKKRHQQYSELKPVFVAIEEVKAVVTAKKKNKTVEVEYKKAVNA